MNLTHKAPGSIVDRHLMEAGGAAAVAGITGAGGLEEVQALTLGSGLSVTNGELVVTGGGYYFQSAAPSNPADGDRWVDTDTGIEYTYVDDGTSAQWVEFAGPGTVGTALDQHLDDTADAHDASAISVADAGDYLSATDVEAALQEIAAHEVVFRNRIINPLMQIDQRNYGAAVTSGYPVDRWSWDYAGAGTVSMQQNIGTAGPAGEPNHYYMRVTVTGVDSSLAAGDVYIISQRVESCHWRDMMWDSAGALPVTLSFYVRSSLTGTFGGALCDDAGTRAYGFSYVINAANTWEKKVITVPGDTGGVWDTHAFTAVSLRLRFSMGSGTDFHCTAGTWAAATNACSPSGCVNLMATNGATWDLTQVQLEKGSKATPFERRPFDTELRLCRRYFARYDNPMMRGVCTSGTQFARMGMTLPVQMRGNPTPSIAGTLYVFDATSAVPVTGVTTWWGRTDSVEFDGTCSAGAFTVGRAAVMYTNDTGGIKLDAEIA